MIYRIQMALQVIFWYSYFAFGRRVLGMRFVSRKISSCPDFFLARLLMLYGAKVGKHSNFKGGLRVDNIIGDRDSTGDFSNLSIGDNCYIGMDVLFDLPGCIRIQNECILSAGVKIMTHQDCGNRQMSRFYPRKVTDVLIGEGTWIGTDAVVLAGVVLGVGCVVGAGAVVTMSFPAYSVIGGVPARLIKTLSNDVL